MSDHDVQMNLVFDGQEVWDSRKRRLGASQNRVSAVPNIPCPPSYFPPVHWAAEGPDPTCPLSTVVLKFLGALVLLI